MVVQLESESRNRLPTLAECLKRNTRPPLDLYCFYLFLQREGAEDTLDFWLDVQQHENLARAYFKDLLKALPLAPSQSPSERQRESAKQIEADWPRYAHYAKTRGSIYNRFTGIEEGDNTSYREYQQELEKKGSDGEHSSAGHESLSGGGEKEWRGGQRTGYDEQLDQEEKLGQGNDYDRVPSPNPSAYPLSPNLRPLYPHEQDPSSLSSGTDSQRRISSPFLRNAKSNQPAAQPFIKRDIAISRSDLISSAERIFSRYLMPGADKEIYLPPALRLTSFPLSSSTLPPPDHPDYELEAAAQAEVPDMFHKQKEFVYSQLKEESFPRFLRAKGFGNLTRMSSVVRLAIGLGALWAGLATAFAFIFLATEPRSTRLWIILPFTVAVFNLFAFAYDLDVILVFMGLSETTPFRTIGIKEPYVRKLLFGRALYVTLFASVIIAAMTLLFYFVPSRRL